MTAAERESLNSIRDMFLESPSCIGSKLIAIIDSQEQELAKCRKAMEKMRGAGRNWIVSLPYHDCTDDGFTICRQCVFEEAIDQADEIMNGEKK